jgi:hypothetical protein
LATKAVELELLPNLASEAFIAALKHFIARSYNNNGSNYVGANRELKMFFKFEEILRCACLCNRHNFTGILFLGFHTILEGCGRQV